MNTSRLKIIMAEDDADDAELFNEALGSFHGNYHLQRVVDGVQFMGLAAGFTPNLFVLDLNLPKVSGKQCLEWLRSSTVMAGIPVVILSTSNNANEISELLNLEGVRYFTKPSSFPALVETVKQIVDLCNPTYA